MQQAYQDFSKFSKLVKLVALLPFKNSLHALEEINSLSEGFLTPCLRNFLELNIPINNNKNVNSQLGISDKTLAATVKQELDFDCVADENVLELIRGIRLHCAKFLKPIEEEDLRKAQLGLGHSYSRAKVKFNVNRVDNMIIQAISIVDQIDKDVNTFSMRVREWYSWHFPELSRLVPDVQKYAKVLLIINDKSRLTEDATSHISEALEGDHELAALIFDASKSSMGADISEMDLASVKSFAKRVISLSQYRSKLHDYLREKMSIVAPNLAALIGDVIGARLISHAGSLTNLSKYPASTVQILGAEKALFRALKTKSKTPKYGLIYHSSFIGKADSKNKGRISRYLANKCSIASRIDCFADVPTDLFGKAMKSQVEQRLSFYDTGIAPQKNLDVMHNVCQSIFPDSKPASKEKKRSIKEGSGKILSKKKKKSDV